MFGVELFVKGDDVWFSEVSPRPHDTGLVTLVSQDLSEFALHARAISTPLERLPEHHEATRRPEPAERVTRAQVQVGQPPGPAAVAPLDGERRRGRGCARV